MKKLMKLFMAFFAVVTVAICFHISTVPAKAEDPHEHCICGFAMTEEAKTLSGHSCSDVEWTAWTKTTSLPTQSGYYYLTDDVLLSSSANIYPDAEVYLCLNGKTVKTKTTRVYSTYGKITAAGDTASTYHTNCKLTVTDCQETCGSVINIKGDNGTNGGGLFFWPCEGGILSIYNGTYSADENYKTTGSGGLFGISKTTKFYLYGGTIIGTKIGNDTTSSNGAAISLGNTVEMYMYGGTVKDGSATGSGGNIYLSSSNTLKLFGGTISGGKAKNGGNIGAPISSTSGSKIIQEISIYGGTVTGGTADIYGGNIYVYGRDTTYFATLNIEGGLITDGWAGVLGGAATSTDTGRGGGNICVGAKAVCNITGGEILNGQSGKNLTGKSYAYGGNLRNEGTMTMSGGKISGGKSGADASVTTSFNIAGNVYNKGTLTLSGNAEISDGWAKNAGGNISNAGTLKILGGKITRGTVASGSGGNIYMDASAAPNILMQGGEISYGKARVGGNIYTKATKTTGDGTFKMTGGKLFGGIATTVGTSEAQGGNIYCTTGTITIAGGEIYDGQCVRGEDSTAACKGGNLMFTACTANITGGTISNGIAGTGGNIYVNGAIVNLTGGTIIGGSTTAGGSGGNIYISGAYEEETYTSQILLDGATVSEGKAYKSDTGSGGHGANILIATGMLTMNSGVIKDGAAEDGGAGGDNIALIGNSTTGDGRSEFYMNGGTISGGTNYLGSVRSWRDENVIAIHGGTISHPKTALSVLSGTLTIDNENAVISSDNIAIELSTKKTDSSVTAGFIKGFVDGNTNRFISGGYFSIAPQRDYCKIPYLPVRATTYEGYSWKIDLGVLVSAISKLEGTDVSVADVAGGDVYAKGAEIDLFAPRIANNATFKGWYDASGTLLSEDASYVITDGVTEDTVFTAVYTQGSDTVMFTVHANFSFHLKADVIDDDIPFGNCKIELPRGTEISLSLSDDTFRYWSNECEKILTREANYTFEIYTDTDLFGCSEEGLDLADTEYMVMFLNDKNQILTTVYTESALTEADLPLLPVRVGKTDGKWDKTLDEINQAIADGTKFTEVKATYTEVESIYTPITGATAPTVEMTLKEATEQGDGKYTLSFGATRSVPTGFTMVEQGIVLTVDAKVTDVTKLPAELVYNSINVTKFRSSGLLPDDITVLNMKNVTEGRTVYARGYVVYTVEGSDDVSVVYTDIYAGTTAGIVKAE